MDYIGMKKKSSAWILLILVLLFVGVRGYFRLTDDFRLGNITHEMPFRSEWEIPRTEEQNVMLEKALNQKYSYIGKGAQSYAFVSDDGKYVLKFFKFKHLRPTLFVDSLGMLPPFHSYYEKQAKRKNRILEGVFGGYRLAYEVHRQETGLHFIQLNVDSNSVNKVVTLRDKIGIERDVDLSKVVFILQEKVVTSRNVIMGLLGEGKTGDAIEKVNALFDLYMTEYAKGIVDHDHGVLHNTGFLGKKPVHLDVGKLHAEESIKEKELSFLDLSLVACRIYLPLKEQYPLEAQEIHQAMNAYFMRTFGKFYAGSCAASPD